MKQYLFLATAIATASLFTGCSNNEYVGDQPEALNGTDGAIAFSMGKANTTRGAELTGDVDANKLNSVFYVYGIKHKDAVGETAASDQVVFNNYKVEYILGTTSASNTKGWEYVGKATESVITPNIASTAQTIKYWDYSADKYTFYAFSALPANINNSKIQVKKITPSDEGTPSYDDGYEVTIKDGASIGDLYFADKEEIAKTATGENVNKYKNPVKLTFRNLAAKVRVGFYETVPGYSIQIKNMYPAADDGFATTATTDKFVAICPNTVASQDSKITVKYYGTGTTDENQAYVVAKNKTDEAGGGDLSAANTLTLGSGVFNNPLETTSSSPTWDTENGDYTFFWPQTGNGSPLKIKVDYTLTSTDGSTEKIEVKGATATIPKEYVAWKANTAYTYIFKISDNTNGTTGTPGSTDPAGLYPITFDAAVVDMAENTYLTTVSTPSVTVSQDGTNFVDPTGLVFKTNQDITLRVMYGGIEVTTDEQTKITGDYIIGNYDYKLTPEQNLKKDCKDITTPQSSTLSSSSQTSAGYWVLKVKISDATFTYVIIRVDKAEDGPETN